jgi:hypothetical protein
VQIVGNGGITGDTEYGVEVFLDSCCDASVKHNHVQIEDNATILGGLGAVMATSAVCCGDNSSSHVSVSRNGALLGGVFGEATAGFSDPDINSNAAVIDVLDNGPMTGGVRGAGLEARAGGSASGSSNNATINVERNSDIRSATQPGLVLRGEVCCDPDHSNANSINVSDNAEIVGDGAGIFVEYNVNKSDVSRNALRVDGNQRITGAGAGANGIDLYTLFGTELSVTHNSLAFSGDAGIDICCGDFAGSSIRDNVIEGNGGPAIRIRPEATHGLTIGPDNTIRQNGGGVLIQGDGSNQNTITQNSIYDNGGPGIDLGSPAGVGCTGVFLQFPNDCISYPAILSFVADTAQGTTCGGCTVELFLADATPADQTGPGGVQYGEGKTFLVSGAATLAGNFSIGLPCGLGAGAITATATDALGNTSEFSRNLAIPGTGSCDVDNDGLTNSFEQGFGGGGISIVNPETGDTGTATGSAAAGSTVTSGSISVTFPPGTQAAGTIVITFVPGAYPGVQIQGALLPPGQTKTVTMPVGSGNGICVNDSATATLADAQGAACGAPPPHPNQCPHSAIKLDVPATVGASTSVSTQTIFPECTPTTYVVTRVNATQVSIAGLVHTALGSCGPPPVPSLRALPRTRVCPPARGLR